MERSITMQKEVRRLLLIFITGLFLSGITAFPIESQLEIAHRGIQYFHLDNKATAWVEKVYEGVREMNLRFPFISYGTDWLAFAHVMIAVAFVGPYRDPVRNIWVVEFGLIACFCIFPLAFIAGTIRQIPFFWQLIDCSFGVFGGLLLWRIHQKIKQLEIVSKSL